MMKPVGQVLVFYLLESKWDKPHSPTLCCNNY